MELNLDIIGDQGATYKEEQPDLGLDDRTLCVMGPCSDDDGGIKPKPKHISLPFRTLCNINEESELAPDYEILGILGEGGMAKVFEARQCSIDRHIALKMLHTDKADSDINQWLFLKEASITANLDHPCIIPVHEVALTEDQEMFITMKQVKGTPWQRVIREKTIQENLDILLRVADAVAFAHSREVLHRDIKPHNVIIGEFGEVFLTDWGLAIAFSEVDSMKALLEGSPPYMAPEMVKEGKRNIGPHSDIYLLGAVLYQIIAGHPPHRARTIKEYVVKVARNEIVHTDRQDEITEIALKSLATNPSDRYPDVKSFQQAIRGYLEHQNSIRMAEEAHAHLEQGLQDQSYDHFARSLFAFEEAQVLWHENEEASGGAVKARMAYIHCSMAKGDFDLARDLFDKGAMQDDQLSRKIDMERKARDRRKKRVKMLSLAAAFLALVIVIGSLAAAYTIKQEQQLTLKEKEKVEKQKKLAEEAKGRAVVAKQKAEQSHLVAEQSRHMAEMENYFNIIALIEKKMYDYEYDHALSLLKKVKSEFRNWEWGRMAALGNLALYSSLHPAQIFSLSFCPEGKCFASGCVNGALAVYDAMSGQKRFDLDGHDGCVLSLTYNHNGTRMVTGGQDKTVKVWDLVDGELLFPPLEGHRQPLGAVRFSLDGVEIYSAAPRDGLIVWNAGTGEKIRSQKIGDNQCLSMAIHPDGSLVLTGDEHGQLKCYDSKTGSLKKVYPRHDAKVLTVAFSEDGTKIISGDMDGTVIVDDTESREKLLEIKAHDAAINAVAFMRDGLHFLTASSDQTACLWDMKGRKVMAMEGHQRKVSAIAGSPDGKMLLSGSEDRTVRLWDVHTGQAYIKTRLDGGPFTAMTVSSCEKWVATGDSEGRACLWDAFTGSKIRELGKHDRKINAVAFDMTGKRVLTGGYDRLAKLWDRETGELIMSFKGHVSEVKSVAFSQDNRHVMTGSTDGDVKLWDLEQGVEVRAFDGHKSFVLDVAFSKDGKRILTCSEDMTQSVDNTARLWDATTGSQLHVFKKGDTPLRSVALSQPDGKYILTGYSNGSATLWDAADGEEIYTIKAHHGDVLQVAFSADGQRLLTAGYDGKVKLWERRTGKETIVICEMTQPVIHCVYGQNGRDVIACTMAGEMIVAPAADWTLSLEDIHKQKTENWLDAIQYIDIRPNDRYFIDLVNVSLHSRIPGAAIGYTLDDSTPTGESMRYEKPIMLVDSTRIHARCIDQKGSMGPSVNSKFYTKVHALSAEDPGDLVPGLAYSYSRGLDFLVAAANPEETGVSPDFTLLSRLESKYMVKISYDGYIDIPSDGMYRFETFSPEKNKLVIADNTLIDNYSKHISDAKSGTIALKKGKHRIHVEFYKREEDSRLTINWQGPDLSRQAIPATVLFHRDR